MYFIHELYSDVQFSKYIQMNNHKEIHLDEH